MLEGRGVGGMADLLAMSRSGAGGLTKARGGGGGGTGRGRGTPKGRGKAWGKANVRW